MPKGPKVPKAQDPTKVIAAQNSANQQAGASSLVGSAIDQSNPYGSIDYSQQGVDQYGNPIMKVDTKFSPEQQAIYDQITGGKQVAAGASKDLLTNANYGAAPDFSAAEGSKVSQNLDRYTEYLHPYFTQQTEELDNQLRNQGLDPGTPAYDRAINNMRQSQNQSVSGFLANTQNQAHAQAVQDYNVPVQTAAALQQLGMYSEPGSAAVNTPQANYGATNASGIYANTYDQKMQAYNAKKAKNDALISGIASIGGAVIGGPIGGMIGNSIGNQFGSGAATAMPWSSATSTSFG